MQFSLASMIVIISVLEKITGNESFGSEIASPFAVC